MIKGNVFKISQITLLTVNKVWLYKLQSLDSKKDPHALLEA